MMRPSPASATWYVQQGAIDHWLCGVFEGGGAKGVAFTGALLEARALKCWFGAVAGASAGSITAALVASGLTPDEIDAETDRALANVRSGIWKGIARLRDYGGYFPSAALTEWLDALLLTRVGRSGPPDAKKRVTFRELHSATGIELNVVAADLSLKRQVVFSHHETPECGVADAVAASSAIPFAFPSQLLAVPDAGSTSGFAHHTIVDGGVWANFPMFVFEDSAFRSYYDRTPREIGPEKIIGFLLDEGGVARVTRGAQVQFASQRGDQEVRALEWLRSSERRGPTAGNAEASTPASAAPIGSRIASWLLWPFAMIGRIVELNGRVERGRWPHPSAPVVRNLMQAVNGLLSGIYPWLLGGFVVFAVGLGSWQIIDQLVGEQLRLLANWKEVASWWVRPLSLLLALLLILIVTLATFAAAFGVVANRILLRASRRISFGLISTYVAGQGAAEWATLRPNIVALPIPPEVGTLSFDIPIPTRQRLTDAARLATRAKLSPLLAGTRQPSPPTGVTITSPVGNENTGALL